MNRVLLITDRLFGENGDLAPDPDDWQVRIDPANEPLSRLIASQNVERKDEARCNGVN